MKYSDRPNAYINAKDLEIAIVKATSYGDSLDAVREAPSIDIVRCGDCKWFNEEYGSCHAYHWDLNQGLEYAEVDADDFCSYGERKGQA